MTVQDHVPLPELVRRRAAEEGAGLAVREVDGRELTWRELHEEADGWATRLTALGVREGDRVLTMLASGATSISLWIGIARLGALEVPVNTELIGALLEHVVRDAEPLVAVVGAAYVGTLAPALEAVGVHRLVVPDIDLASDIAIPPGAFERVVTGRPPPEAREEQRPIEEWDVATILYTSGTTGPSKGVVVSWGQMTETALGSIPSDDLGPNDAFYSPFGMAHVTARSAAQFTAQLGSTLVLRPRFSASEYWSDIARYGCTTTVLMGAMAYLLERRPASAEDGTTPLHNVLMAPLIPAYQQFAERFGLRLCTVFNMTEVSVPIASNGWVITDAGVCGRARPGYECRVVDEFDREVPAGTVGELVVRHTDPWRLLSGYWRNPEKTTEAWRNLWFHTGDAFSRDADGSFRFRDRVKDVIRRRGENISSIELERAANLHPSVAETAAVGVPSEFGEEDVKLFVVPRPDARASADELLAYLQEQVPRFMVPRYLEFVDDLPRTATEKLDKKRLRQQGNSSATWDAEAPQRANVSGS